MNRIHCVLIALLFPLTLLAQPQVEWVWTDSATMQSYSSIGFDVTLDNGVVLTSDYDTLTVRLDSLGQEVWRKDNTGGTSIARLNDGSFILPYSRGLYQIDSSGSFVDSIVLSYQGYRILLGHATQLCCLSHIRTVRGEMGSVCPMTIPVLIALTCLVILLICNPQSTANPVTE
ncbi:MAG: hypothetical protein IPP40_15395 [bacterium]|nr:hypothetical protein [bacterium]